METYNGIVATDGSGAGCERVGGTENDTAGLDGITSLPDHGGNWAGSHIWTLMSARTNWKQNEGFHTGN